MTGSLAGIVLALLLSATSLTLVLFRVSPVTAPEFALPFFFGSILIAASTAAALLLSLTRCLLAHQPILCRAFLTPSLRQGAFFGLATCLILFLHLLQILNWWIALLIYAVFLLLEMAVGR